MLDKIVDYKGKVLYFDGVNVLAFTKKYRTPSFLFSERVLKKNFHDFVTYFSKNYKNIRVDYSVKTNNEIGVLKILAKEGAAAEIVAGYELHLSKRAGFETSRITFDGPAKSDKEIALGIKGDIHAFYADSASELVRINSIAQRLGKKARVGVRVNLGLKSILEGPAETYIGKFGINYSEVVDVLKVAKKFKNLEIMAISTHIGSQILSIEPYLRAADMMAKLAKELVAEGINLTEINLGGGFPSQTLLKMTLPGFLLSSLGLAYEKNPMPLKEFGYKISERFARNIKRFNLPLLTLVFQPGRAISSNMGIAVSQIRVVKEGWIFLDISTSSLPESIFFAQRRLLTAKKPTRNILQKYSVAGRGLNSADNFAINVKLPKLTVGDIIVILDAGAYSISRSNRFTALNPPVYLFKENGNIQKIRRAETYRDVLGPMEF